MKKSIILFIGLFLPYQQLSPRVDELGFFEDSAASPFLGIPFVMYFNYLTDLLPAWLDEFITETKKLVGRTDEVLKYGLRESLEYIPINFVSRETIRTQMDDTCNKFISRDMPGWSFSHEHLHRGEGWAQEAYLPDPLV